VVSALGPALLGGDAGSRGMRWMRYQAAPVEVTLEEELLLLHRRPPAGEGAGPRVVDHLRCGSETSAPFLGSLNGKRRSCPGEWCQKLQTYRSVRVSAAARRHKDARGRSRYGPRYPVTGAAAYLYCMGAGRTAVSMLQTFGISVA
jgi:hypothetical protein